MLTALANWRLTPLLAAIAPPKLDLSKLIGTNNFDSCVRLGSDTALISLYFLHMADNCCPLFKTSRAPPAQVDSQSHDSTEEVSTNVLLMLKNGPYKSSPPTQLGRKGHGLTAGTEIHHAKLTTSHNTGIVLGLGAVQVGSCWPVKQKKKKQVRNVIGDGSGHKICPPMSHLRWRSCGPSTGCTCRLWGAAGAAPLSRPGHPDCFWTGGGMTRLMHRHIKHNHNCTKLYFPHLTAHWTKAH